MIENHDFEWLYRSDIFETSFFCVLWYYTSCIEGKKSQICHFCIAIQRLDSLLLPYHNVIKSLSVMHKIEFNQVCLVLIKYSFKFARFMV